MQQFLPLRLDFKRKRGYVSSRQKEAAVRMSDLVFCMKSGIRLSETGSFKRLLGLDCLS